MPRRHIAWVAVLVVSMAVVGPAAGESDADSLSETWYLLRGRANMKIGNYKAAIEAFEKAAELDPANREALRSLGRAYEKQGLTDKAIEQYDRYLDRFDDDPEVAFKQAEYLTWDRYAYRRADAIRYFRMGLTQEEDLPRRHALARLLAEDRGALDEALAQYEVLLEAQPENEAWRAEYRDLLLWDPDRLSDAIREYRRLAARLPDDVDVRITLARLIARQDPRSKEAMGMYAGLVAARLRDTALRLEYARLLAKHRSERDEALSQYRLVLESAPTSEVREEYADLLAARDETRQEAFEQYVLLLSESPGDVPVRMKYARLLSGERADTQRAIAQYDLVLVREPANAEAHAGLASAYSWIGDRDRSLEHANLAARYGRARTVEELRESLRLGREPRLEPMLRGLVQRGRARSELNGIGLGLKGQFDPTPFATVRFEAGFEDYWRAGANTAGGFFGAEGEYRIDPKQTVGGGLAFHTLGRSSGRGVVGDIHYARKGDLYDWKVGFQRTLRFDSYAALVGDSQNGTRIGEAREQRFFGTVSTDRGPLQLSATPYTGWVDSIGVGANPFVGLRGELDYTLLERDRWVLRGVFASDLYHYRDNAFGIDASSNRPLPGGYFSPQFFFEVVPGVSASFKWGPKGSVLFEGGPALQFVKESPGSTAINVGGYADLSYLLAIRETLYWTLDARFLRIGDVYTRVGAYTSVIIQF